MAAQHVGASRALLDRLQADPEFRCLNGRAKRVLRQLVWRYRNDLVGSYHVEAARDAAQVEEFARAILGSDYEQPWESLDLDLLARAHVAARRLELTTTQADSPSQMRSLARTASASMNAAMAHQKLHQSLLGGSGDAAG